VQQVQQDDQAETGLIILAIDLNPAILKLNARLRLKNLFF
jgi:hypothetical protein